MSTLTVSLHCCSQPAFLLHRTAAFCSLGTYLWSYSKFWRALQSLVELWEERLYPAELLGKFSSTIANFFSYNGGQGKCSAFTLHLVRNKKCLLEFLYCQLEHQTDVGHSGGIHLDPCEVSSEIAQSVRFCRMVTSVAFWPGSKHWLVRQACFQVLSYTGNVFLGRGRRHFCYQTQTSKRRALITGRFPIDFGQSYQWCSAGHYFSIKQFLTCWYASVRGNYSLLKKHLKYFHGFLKSCWQNSCACSPVPCFFHMSTEMLHRKGLLTKS